MPKKMRRLAIRSVLSVKAQDEQLLVIEGLTQLEPKTRNMVSLLEKLPASQRSTLIVIGPGADQELVYRSARNIDNVKVIRAGVVNVQDVLKHERLLLTTEAVETIHSLWSMQEEGSRS